MTTLRRSNELGLLIFDYPSSSIHWYSRCGHRLLGKYKCEDVPIDLAICAFSTSGKYNKPVSNQEKVEEKVVSVVVLQKPKVLRIYSSRGDTYDVNLQIPIRRLWAFPSGLILESVPNLPSTFRGDSSIYSVSVLSLDFYVSNLMHLTHPLASPVPLTQGVHHVRSLTETLSPFEHARRQSFDSVASGAEQDSPRSPDFLVNAKDMVVLASRGNLLFVYYRSTGQVALLLATSRQCLTSYLEDAYPIASLAGPSSNPRSGRLSSMGSNVLSPDSSKMKVDSARTASPFHYFRAASPSIPGLEHLAHLQPSTAPSTSRSGMGVPSVQPGRTVIAATSKVNYFSKRISSGPRETLSKQTGDHQKKPNRYSTGRPSTLRGASNAHSDHSGTPSSDLAAVLLGERRRTIEPDIEREAYRDRERAQKRKLANRSQLNASPTFEPKLVGFSGHPSSGNSTETPRGAFSSIAAPASTLPSSEPSSQLPNLFVPGSALTGVTSMRRGSTESNLSRIPSTDAEVRDLFIDTSSSAAAGTKKAATRGSPLLQTVHSPSNHRHSVDGFTSDHLNVTSSHLHENDTLPHSTLLLTLASATPSPGTIFPQSTTATVEETLKDLTVEFVGDLNSPFGLSIYLLNATTQAMLCYKVTPEPKELFSGRVSAPVWSTSELDQIRFTQSYQLAFTPVAVPNALPSAAYASTCPTFQFQYVDTIDASSSSTRHLKNSQLRTELPKPLSLCHLSLDLDLATSGTLPRSISGNSKSSFRLPLCLSVQQSGDDTYSASIALGHHMLVTVPFDWRSQEDSVFEWDSLGSLLGSESTFSESPAAAVSAMSVESPSKLDSPGSSSGMTVSTLGNGLTTHFLLTQVAEGRESHSVVRLPVGLFQGSLLCDCVKAVMMVLQGQPEAIQAAVLSFLFITSAQKCHKPIELLLASIFGVDSQSQLSIELRAVCVGSQSSESLEVASRIFEALHSVLEDRRLTDAYSAEEDAAVGLLRGLYIVASQFHSATALAQEYTLHYSRLQPSLRSAPVVSSFQSTLQIPVAFNKAAGGGVDGKRWLAECFLIITDSIRGFKASADVSLIDPQKILLPSFLPVEESPLTTGSKAGWSAKQPFASIHLLHRFFQNVVLGMYMYAKSLANKHPETNQSSSSDENQCNHMNRDFDKSSWRMIIAKAFVSAIKSSETGHILADGSTLDVDATLQYLPAAVRAAVTVSLLMSKEQPSSRWPVEVLTFIGRQDIALRVNRRLLAHQLEPNENHPQHRLLNQHDGSAPKLEPQLPNKGSPQNGAPAKVAVTESLDGLREIESLSFEWFPQDERVREVCRMLKSSKHIYLRVDRAPEWSDVEFRERQHAKLVLLGRRALALGVGRGMMTVKTLVPLMAEPLPLPQLVVTARCAPNNLILSLDPTVLSPEFLAWPEFHNGAAAGLRIGFASPSPLDVFNEKRLQGSSVVPSANSSKASLRYSHRQRGVGTVITRNFITYNKFNAVSSGRQAAFAGCLMALGIQGHLQVLSKNDIVEYLSSRDDQISIATLIGVGASRLGSADPQTSKALCMQVPALLPPAWVFEVEIPSTVQCAAFSGLGLLYCGTGHRLMAELLLDELTRKPVAHNGVNREAIALSVGWALGMVLLGKGESNVSSSAGDSNEADYTFMGADSNTSTAGEIGKDTSASTGRKPRASESIPPTPRQTFLNADSEKVTTEELESDTLLGLADLHIEDRLQLLIHGGKRPDPQQSLFSPSVPTFDQNSRSSRVLEGDFINTDVTSVSATIALALVYLRTNNTEIAKRIALPTTVSLLDKIRPDFMMYRSLASCLILWDSVVPSDTWLQSRIPDEVKKALFDKSKPAPTTATASSGTGGASAKHAAPDDRTLDRKLSKFEIKLASAAAASEATASSNTQGQRELAPYIALALYLNTVTGLCLGVGLVHAGTAAQNAKEVLVKQLQILQGLREGKPAGDIFKTKLSITKALKPTLESCIGAVALALACVMSGSGDLDSLRIIRELRWKTEDVTYGTHLSLNMAIGLLFLGGGRASLRRYDLVSTACLLIAILPKYPIKTLDNQFHLQALRHLYAVAVESRALQTVDVDTNESVTLLLEIHMRDGSRLYKSTPCLLPELCTVKAVHMKTDLVDSLAADKHARMSRSKKQQLQEILKSKELYHNKDYLPASLDLEHEPFESKLFVKQRGSREARSVTNKSDSILEPGTSKDRPVVFKRISELVEPLLNSTTSESGSSNHAQDVSNTLQYDRGTQTELSELLSALTCAPAIHPDDSESLLSSAIKTFEPFVRICDEALWKI